MAKKIKALYSNNIRMKNLLEYNRLRNLNEINKLKNELAILKESSLIQCTCPEAIEGEHECIIKDKLEIINAKKESLTDQINTRNKLYNYIFVSGSTSSAKVSYNFHINIPTYTTFPTIY